MKIIMIMAAILLSSFIIWKTIRSLNFLFALPKAFNQLHILSRFTSSYQLSQPDKKN